MKLRATHDQSVIDQWSAKIAAHDRRTGRVQTVLFAALFACFISMFVWPKLPLFIATSILFACALVSQLIEKEALTCPHCGRSPVTGRASPRSADFCAHCFYWLISPYEQVDRSEG
ncbi:hypothetical protein [Pseudomonas sp. Hp2]|uniref:hypothetical protein n=1 Tax=Pseudomonas sp. Hp2 TaxID=701189 RepID=UPI001125EE58|nr:hypothetical protein [Pseudomonas sp. Hp2]